MGDSVEGADVPSKTKVYVPGSDDIVHLSALATAFAPSTVRGVETVSQGEMREGAPTPRTNAAGNGSENHALRRDGLTERAASGDSER